MEACMISSIALTMWQRLSTAVYILVTHVQSGHNMSTIPFCSKPFNSRFMWALRYQIEALDIENLEVPNLISYIEDLRRKYQKSTWRESRLWMVIAPRWLIVRRWDSSLWRELEKENLKSLISHVKTTKWGRTILVNGMERSWTSNVHSTQTAKS